MCHESCIKMLHQLECTASAWHHLQGPASFRHTNTVASLPKLIVSLQVADLLMLSEYQEVDLDTDPVILLKCGHLFTCETMDRHMKLEGAYDVDQNGEVAGPENISP